ncbi:MAG: dTDP-4-dehydrorhamnose reductase [Bacteroidota bacterium]|nr:dTDP-4-dehydrorhamnose reductase [Bacteroidota bacterium]
MKRILVCGSNGLLGQKLAWMLAANSEFEVLHTSHHRNFFLAHQPLDYTQLDISNRSDVKSLVSSFRPDAILNAAAMADVDQCEKEREQAWKVNVVGVENLVEVARRINAKLVHISTDYVFDGKTPPYDEQSRVNPINYYGKTKLAGENVVLIGDIDFAILRTIVVYGTGVNVRNNFALWVIRNLQEGKNIRCFDDQISNPTHVQDLAQAMINCAVENRKGIYHTAGAEIVSRYDFALRAAEIFGLDKELIERSKSSASSFPAVRPLNTSFTIGKAKKEIHYHPMNVTQGLELLKKELQGINLN